jgi:uncharacterized membrane protein
MNTNNEKLRSWNDSANWSRRGLFGLYFSKRDTRVVVPKAIPALGWTFNLGQPAGAALFLGFVVGAAGLAAAVVATIMSA